MKRILKYLGCGLLGLVLVVGCIGFFFYRNIDKKRNSRIAVTVSEIEVPTDEASIREGRRLVRVKACADCHGADMAGKVFVDDPAVGTLTGSNLTRGQGSVILDYKDTDWVRAMRFGLSPEGRPLMGMPAGDFHGTSKEDLGKMIAFLKTLPPVDRESPRAQVGPLGVVLYNLGQLPLLFPFEEVDLLADNVDRVQAEGTPEYGRYLAQACTGCHGAEFAGGKIPGTPPSWPPARNLTPGGRTANWTLAEFTAALKEGRTPDGHQIDPAYMPWRSLAAMTDVEVEALYRFFQQIPPKEGN